MALQNLPEISKNGHSLTHWLVSPDPNFPPTLNNLKMVVFALNFVHMFSGTIPTKKFFFIFQNSPPIPPWGGIPPKVPHLEISSDYLENLYVCSVPHYLTIAVFSFPKFSIPLFPPRRGGLPPPKFQNLEILSDCLETWYVCSLAHYSRTSSVRFPKLPPVPPLGEKSPPPPNPPISKYRPITLKFGI